MFAKFLTIPLLAMSACAASETFPESMGGEFDTHSSDIVRFASDCEKWDDWEKPARPFQISADTYYVGTCGIAAILIKREDGYALIDSGTEGGADIVLANIRSLGIDPADITILLASHEHFDHVGGMAKLQEATGGLVISSEIAIKVMTTGEAHPDDPQAGTHEPMQPIAPGSPYSSDEARALLGKFGITALSTPGHSPGAMSWSWESCAGEDCKTIVYADSLSPVSRDDYKFSEHPEYVREFLAGLANLAALDCDILLTPHPSHSKMVERAATGTFEGGMSCAGYASEKIADLEARLQRDLGGDQ